MKPCYLRIMLSCAIVMIFSIATIPSLAVADDAKWKADTIADAELAAPPVVTETATIYGWSSEGKMVLAREGTGPYTCVASGAFSLRLGKPPLPYPDPMCMDQNAWAFFQAMWSEKIPLSLRNLIRRPQAWFGCSQA